MTKGDNNPITFSEFKMWSEHLIKEMAKHQTPSQETLERLDKLECCLFGTDDDKGVKQMVTEIYDVFKGTRFTGKMLVMVFGSIGLVSGGIYALFKIIRDIAK